MTPGWVELTGFEPVTPWLQTTFGRILANYSVVLQQLRELSTRWRTTRNVSVRTINTRWIGHQSRGQQGRASCGIRLERVSTGESTSSTSGRSTESSGIMVLHPDCPHSGARPASNFL